MDAIDLPLLAGCLLGTDTMERQLVGLIKFCFLVSGEISGGDISMGSSVDVSNHFPIILKYNNQLWAPKRFRFNYH